MNKIVLFTFTGILATGLILASPLVAQDNGSEVKTESIEDFETGDFSLFEWQFSGNSNWTVTDVNPYEGTFSARSGVITHNQTSSLFLEYEVYDAQPISFYFRVSSESNYDYLRFYIDNVQQGQWSGTQVWQLISYSTTVGTHTFKWEYSKDGSVNTGEDACWIDFITFPPAEITAAFTCDTNIICKGDVVFFYDQSTGPVTQWNWIFEGAVPMTSTLQNPIVGYPNIGTFDVFLEVSDGIESSVIYMADYMVVNEVLQSANTPTGISFLCATWGNTTYNTVPVSGATSYNWMVMPPSAGSISGNGNTNITMVWDPGFLGQAELSVAGVNYCGTGVYSNPLVITRYLPEVSVILPAYVAISTPPFQLTGGTPPGGTYSGPGVSNGIFDPAAAGLGEHTITYTYTDVNLCTNSATDLITVTQFTDIAAAKVEKQVQVFPNPGTGNFKIKISPVVAEVVAISVYSSMNHEVYRIEDISLVGGFEQELDLSHLSNGIYYLRVNGKQMNTVQKIIISK